MSHVGINAVCTATTLPIHSYESLVSLTHTTDSKSLDTTHVPQPLPLPSSVPRSLNWTTTRLDRATFWKDFVLYGMLETSMETSFYPDETTSTSYVKMRNLKRMMTLDLEGPSSTTSTTASKRGRYPPGGLLSSPDLNMLKLGSPELENLLIQQHGQVTTTPTPGQFSFPKTVTEEQELYARGFVDALAELHQHSTASPHFPPSSPSNSSSDDLSVINNVPAYHHNIQQQQQQQYHPNGYSDYLLPMIKEEPQTVPSGSGLCSRDTPPLSPIDLMAQERIKLERKRQRNRLAASKCRRRKLERIARLEDKVKLLKDDNSELGVVVAKLKEHICHLKEQLMEHVNSGCQVMTTTQNEYLS